MKLCKNPDCSKRFTAQSHNQKYCDEDCRSEVTNRRVRKQYYEQKAIREGKHRVCANNGCFTVLSRYNTEPVCGPCESSVQARGRELLEYIA